MVPIILHIGHAKILTWLQNAIFLFFTSGLIDFLNLDLRNTDILKLLRLIKTFNFTSIEDAKFLEKEIKKFNKYLKTS